MHTQALPFIDFSSSINFLYRVSSFIKSSSLSSSKHFFNINPTFSGAVSEKDRWGYNSDSSKKYLFLILSINLDRTSKIIYLFFVRSASVIADVST